MKATTMFTTTITPHVLSWLTDQAKKMNITKRALLEQAINYYKIEIERKELAKGFRKATNDPDIKIIAEEGLTDYNKILKSFDI